MQNSSGRIVLITGGAGFIGSNLAQRLLTESDAHVRIFDNLSRPGVGGNIEWLQQLAGRNRLEVVRGDVREPLAVKRAVRGVNEIYHLAAQVAVTTSIEDPETDFDVNVRGTFNVLEAARTGEKQPFVLFTSTNKVYGSLRRLQVEVDGTHYRARQRGFRGVTEDEPLDFHSPYGCSKGAADQYVRDYARIYALPTVVFRMSCIAGGRQLGNEDQGWVAHFVYSVLMDRPITIYGDGYQVRDVLHVDDLVDAMMAARSGANRTRGQVYNLGGGPARAVSVREMLRRIEIQTGSSFHVEHAAVRPGDQPLYIADTAKLKQDTGWQPRRSLDATIDTIYRFWTENRMHVLRSQQDKENAAMARREVA